MTQQGKPVYRQVIDRVLDIQDDRHDGLLGATLEFLSGGLAKAQSGVALLVPLKRMPSEVVVSAGGQVTWMVGGDHPSIFTASSIFTDYEQGRELDGVVREIVQDLRSVPGTNQVAFRWASNYSKRSGVYLGGMSAWVENSVDVFHCCTDWLPVVDPESGKRRVHLLWEHPVSRVDSFHQQRQVVPVHTTHPLPFEVENLAFFGELCGEALVGYSRRLPEPSSLIRSSAQWGDRVYDFADHPRFPYKPMRGSARIEGDQLTFWAEGETHSDSEGRTYHYGVFCDGTFRRVAGENGVPSPYHVWVHKSGKHPVYVLRRMASRGPARVGLFESLVPDPLLVGLDTKLNRISSVVSIGHEYTAAVLYEQGVSGSHQLVTNMPSVKDHIPRGLQPLEVGDIRNNPCLLVEDQVGQRWLGFFQIGNERLRWQRVYVKSIDDFVVQNDSLEALAVHKVDNTLIFTRVKWP